MYRNTRYDAQDYATLGLASRLTTTGYPLTVVGEEIRRNGQRFYVNGHGFHALTYGSNFTTISRAQLDDLLDRMVASGVNAISVMEMDLLGLVPSGPYAGRQNGCFRQGYVYAAGRTWTAGQRTTTTDTSGVTRVSRTYVCTSGGTESGGGSTGPTGTGSSTVGGIGWTFEATAYTVYDEQFFTGDGAGCGFDYFISACGQRGIYVDIRFDNWAKTFIGANGGYALNGRSGVSAGNLANHRGLWMLDGTSGTVDMVAAFKAHLNQFLDRINSVNGKRYGDDHTIACIDLMNEQGVATWYFGTTNTSSPSGNTFDYLCYAGSSVPGGSQAEPNAAVVAWWDAAWLAWYSATYPGHTPNGDYAGKGNALPCYAYTGLNGGAANNIAQRATFRAGVYTDGYLARVSKFLMDTEANWASGLISYIRGKSSHILVHVGQHYYGFASTHRLGDIVDMHSYGGATNSIGNPSTVAITAGGGKGVSWAAGTLTVVFNSVPTTPLAVGMSIKVTQTSGGSWTGTVVIATLFTTTSTNDSFTATGVADPVTITGTQVSATADIPSVDFAGWYLHAVTANDTASTRIHYRNASGVDTDLDVAGWIGVSGLGSLAQMGDNMHNGKPTFATEFSPGRGVTHPLKSLYTPVYILLDLLQGGSGVFSFAWVQALTIPGMGEHNIPGDGERIMQSQMTALLARYVSPFPSADIAYVQESDYVTYLAKHNTTDLASTTHALGQSYGYIENCTSFYWQSILNKRVRLDYGTASAPSTQTYTLPNTLWTHPQLNDPTTMAGLFGAWYGMGPIFFENPKVSFIAGRLPTDSVASSIPLTKMQFSTIDGKAWYGFIMWVSLDGSDLGTGRSALYTWCYSREEVQKFRRLEVVGGVGHCNHFLDDLTGFYTSDAATQPGVVMRNGLHVKLAMTDTAKRARIIERYGVQREQIVSHAGGYMTILPSQPLTLIS